MSPTLADRARALEGRTVTVTTHLDSEPWPITGRLGHVHEDSYLDLLDVPGRDRSTVRVQLAHITNITEATENSPMPQIKPMMTTKQAVARKDAHAWAAGTLVWATWPADSPWPAGPEIPLEWVPGRVLGPAREEKTRLVEVEVYGGRETVPRADAELLLRWTDDKTIAQHVNDTEAKEEA